MEIEGRSSQLPGMAGHKRRSVVGPLADRQTTKGTSLTFTPSVHDPGTLDTFTWLARRGAGRTLASRVLTATIRVKNDDVAGRSAVDGERRLRGIAYVRFHGHCGHANCGVWWIDTAGSGRRCGSWKRPPVRRDPEPSLWLRSCSAFDDSH